MDYELQNTVYLMGYIAGEPTHNKTKQRETPVTSLTLAVSRGYRDRETGNYAADFLRCVAWNKLSLLCGTLNLEKGDFIAIKGKVRTSRWTSKETGEQRQGTEIRLSEIKVLRKKGYVPRQDAPAPNGAGTEELEALDLPDGIEDANVLVDEPEGEE